MKTKDGDIIVLYKVTFDTNHKDRHSVFAFCCILYLHLQDAISGQITKKIVLTQEDYDQLLILVSNSVHWFERFDNCSRWARLVLKRSEF